MYLIGTDSSPSRWASCSCLSNILSYTLRAVAVLESTLFCWLLALPRAVNLDIWSFGATRGRCLPCCKAGLMFASLAALTPASIIWRKNLEPWLSIAGSPTMIPGPFSIGRTRNQSSNVNSCSPTRKVTVSLALFVISTTVFVSPNVHAISTLSVVALGCFSSSFCVT